MRRLTSPSQRLLQLARKKGILLSSDAANKGIHSEYLRRLTAAGLLIRTGRGLYVPSDFPLTANHTLAEAARRVPRAVVCLLSAARFHELGTQPPRQVWMAIGPHSREPRVSSPPIRFVRFSGRALSEGIESHRIEGVEVRVFSAAKTVVDCMKYWKKIGLDVAIEVLKSYLRDYRGDTESLLRFARMRGVAARVKSYLEALS